MTAFAGRRLLMLVVLTAAMYAPFLGGGWLTDDFVHLDRLERSTVADIFTSPDPFGFYRPIPHASLLIDLKVSGRTPWAFRLTNLLLHTGVVCVAYLLALMLLGHEGGAFLATLAFVLTPKAHPMAVLWPSARPELMMALLSLLAIVFWILWERRQERRWLAAACVSYLLALMSKETAAALPLLLLVTPAGSHNPVSRRAFALGAMALIAAAVIVVRVQAGALMLAEIDGHYNLTTPFSRWVRNARNYFERAIPSPLVLLLMVGIPMLLTAPRGARLRPAGAAVGPLAIFAGAWFLVFILPVLPIAGRSELYLYLPGFGLCVLVGLLLSRLSLPTRSGWMAAAVGAYVAAVGSYQLSRVVSVHRDAQFSTRFVEVLVQYDALRTYSGVVVVVPEDPQTEEILRGSIGGYLGPVLQATLGRGDIDGVVMYPTMPAVTGGLRLICAFRNDQILLYSTAAAAHR